MDTPNTQNNTSRMRESRKLEQKRKRLQQVRRQKIFLACSCLILTAGIGLFVTLYHNHQRAAAQEAELRKQIKQKHEAELQKQQKLEIMIICMNTSGMISLPQTSPQSMKKASLYPIMQTFLLIPLSDPLWKSVMHLLPPDSISWNRQTTMFLTRESPVLPILSDTGKPVTRKLLSSVSMIPQKMPVKSLPSVARMLLFPFSTTQLQ